MNQTSLLLCHFVLSLKDFVKHFQNLVCILSYLPITLAIEEQIILNNTFDVLICDFFKHSFIGINDSLLIGMMRPPLHKISKQPDHSEVIIIVASNKTRLEIL